MPNMQCNFVCLFFFTFFLNAIGSNVVLKSLKLDHISEFQRAVCLGRDFVDGSDEYNVLAQKIMSLLDLFKINEHDKSLIRFSNRFGVCSMLDIFYYLKTCKNWRDLSKILLVLSYDQYRLLSFYSEKLYPVVLDINALKNKDDFDFDVSNWGELFLCHSVEYQRCVSCLSAILVNRLVMSESEFDFWIKSVQDNLNFVLKKLEVDLMKYFKEIYIKNNALKKHLFDMAWTERFADSKVKHFSCDAVEYQNCVAKIKSMLIYNCVMSESEFLRWMSNMDHVFAFDWKKLSVELERKCHFVDRNLKDKLFSIIDKCEFIDSAGYLLNGQILAFNDVLCSVNGQEDNQQCELSFLCENSLDLSSSAAVSVKSESSFNDSLHSLNTSAVTCVYSNGKVLS